MNTPQPRRGPSTNILGDWDDVRYFLAVAKTGSFSAAADYLDTKQTTVGRRISAMERRLGAKLFDRHRHGMEVTPAARGVLAQAEQMMGSAAAIERHLAGLDREMAGIVRVTATEGIAANWLVPRLNELRRLHPDIIVQVISGDQVLDLATRQADIAIRFVRPSANQLVAAKVGATAMSVFVAQNYVESFGMPQTLEELKDHDLIDQTVLHNLPVMRSWSEVIEQCNSVVLRTNSSYAAMEAVRVGYGLSVFPDYAMKANPLLAAPIDLGISREIFLVSHEETNKGARIRTVIDFLREQFRRDEKEWFSGLPPVAPPSAPVAPPAANQP